MTNDYTPTAYQQQLQYARDLASEDFSLSVAPVVKQPIRGLLARITELEAEKEKWRRLANAAGEIVDAHLPAMKKLEAERDAAEARADKRFRAAIAHWKDEHDTLTAANTHAAFMLIRAMARKEWRIDGWEVPAIDVQSALDLLDKGDTSTAVQAIQGDAWQDGWTCGFRDMQKAKSADGYLEVTPTANPCRASGEETP